MNEGQSNLSSNHMRGVTRTTGNPSFSCEMIILQTKSHGQNIRVCTRIFTMAPLLGSKNTVKFSKWLGILC